MNKYLIISDIHLGDKHSRADLVLKVLKENKAKTIIIAGDLFDHHNLHRLNKTHWKVLSKLRKLSKKCKIIYLIGNHCFLKAEFMSILLGFNCKDEHIIDLKDEKVLVVHGDIFDIFSTKWKWATNFIIKFYYFLRKFTSFANDILQLPHNKNMPLAKKILRTRQNAINYIELNGYDKVICGHTHFPEKNKKYINTGSFCQKKIFKENFNSHKASFVVIDRKNKIQIKKY
jgi:UDP-2,3-diacylglucosamine pyrophosphatase LpxH